MEAAANRIAIGARDGTNDRKASIGSAGKCNPWRWNRLPWYAVGDALLTIREAAETTGHSTHKIRRLIKAIGDDAGHSDRSLVEPSPADVERLNGEGVQFTWRIEEELVRRRLGDVPAATSSRTEQGRGESGNVLALLERAMHAKEEAEAKLFEQLKTKDNQIAGLQQTVTSLNECLRESNVLMASLQRQLPEGKELAVGVANEGRKARRQAASDQPRSSPAAEAPASMAQGDFLTAQGRRWYRWRRNERVTSPTSEAFHPKRPHPNRRGRAEDQGSTTGSGK